MTTRAMMACLLLFGALTLAVPMASQRQVGGSGATVMMATERYLFVIRQDQLLQFDVDTLELRNSVLLPPGAAGRLHPRVAPTPGTAAAEPPGPPSVARGDIGRRGARPALPGRAHSGAVLAGLQWLAAHQDQDGRWDCDEFMKHDAVGEPCDGAGNPTYDVGATALALLALLGDGNTMRSGPFKDNVALGVSWLVGQQGDNGLFGTNASHDFIYDHAIAAYAMCEACGLSQRADIRSAAQRGIDYLESHRNPDAVWRYQPRDSENDTSVTIWALMAYRAAKDFDLEINDRAIEKVASWLDKVTDDKGRTGYTKRGEPSSRMPGDHGRRFPVDKVESLTAAGLLGRFLLGQTPEQKPVMHESTAVLLARPPKWDAEAGTIDAYYWFMGSHAMFQMGGQAWQRWSSQLPAAVVDHQRRQGNCRGSWDPVGVWAESSGGRIYATALCTLALQSSYRYSRLNR